MFATQRLALVVAVALLSAACGGGGGGGGTPAPSSAGTTAPVVTAPPTLTPEEQAEADIQATFEELIAAWDDFKANASDYVDEASSDPAWNFVLVESEMRMLDEAQVEFLNSTNVFLDSEVEQVGRTVVAEFDVHDVEFSRDGSASAQGRACLDLSGLSFTTYRGSSAELPAEPSAYQGWTFTARFLPSRTGWFITKTVVDLTETCS
ncbi:hypothetical protein [Jiangella muralis]|uniref:hypothetical protein n=1 Tax=Jiangella muralis TaxID=702383 RepID=UPI00069F03CB|nr:hypothetical protein [Jiangella muralis]